METAAMFWNQMKLAGLQFRLRLENSAKRVPKDEARLREPKKRFPFRKKQVPANSAEPRGRQKVVA
jgi:hypothetical protein